MDKLNYGAFDPTNTDAVFTDTSYTDPTSETVTRKQLSYPLKEIKDFVNKTVSIDSQGNALQLKLDYENSALYYSTDGSTYNPVDFYGQQGQPGQGVASGGTEGQVLVKASDTDYDTEWTTIDVSAQIQSAISNIFPIGYVYISVSPTDPSTYFGGTWEQITSDAYLKIVTGNGGQLGGTSATHQIPVSSMPSHTHTQNTVVSGEIGAPTSTSYIIGARSSGSGSTGSAGGGEAYYPYYLGVYVWKRTA